MLVQIVPIASITTHTYQETDSYDKEYSIEPKVTEYTLDRTGEYTNVLAANEQVNIYILLIQTSTGNIKGTTVVKVKNKSPSINKAIAPIKRTIVALKCPKKEKKAWYEEAWDGVKSFGKDVWNGLTGAASWIWSKVCDAGSFLIQGAQQILSMIDDVLDVVAFGAAVAVFAAGVNALGTSIASTIPALATKVVLGHAIGAIGGYSTGFALFTGKIAVGASGAQIISGASGYGLDFKKISKGEAKSRVANGIRNLSITYVGLESVMVSDLIKGEFRDGGGQG